MNKSKENSKRALLIKPMDCSTFVSDNCLDVPTAIETFEQIQKHYSIRDKEWKPIQKEISLIKSRMNDATLYLGVVGEASAGKSTFINAMLGFKFLKEDILLGTTAAATVIRYGKDFGITVNYLQSEKKEHFNETALGISSTDQMDINAEKILNAVRKYTVDEDVAATVYSVEIFLPVENDLLKSGVAIVDTPGINSVNKRHNEITTRTIKEICDAAIILIPANVPLSSYLSEYVKQNLPEVLSRCILLMTQEDLLEPEERLPQLEYISQRMKTETHEDVAGCFKTAAYYMLDRKKSKRADEASIQQFRQEFAAMMGDIHTIVSECRKAAIFEKILVLIKSSLLPLLSKLVETERDSYKTRRDTLEQNQLIDLGKFIKEKQEEYEEELNCVIIPFDDISSAADNAQSFFVDKMNEKIYDAEDVDDIELAMDEDEVKKVVSKAKTQFKKDIQKAASPYNEKHVKLLTDFHNEFSDAYQRLESVSSQASSSDLVEIKHPVMKVSMSDSLSEFGSALETIKSDDLKVSGIAGTVLGAALGSIIPGVGTIIGGLLGGFLGAIFGSGPDLEDVQAEASNVVDEIGYEIRDCFYNAGLDYDDKYKKASIEKMRESLDKYQEQFGETIATMIQEEKKEQDMMLALTEVASKDLSSFREVSSLIEIALQTSKQKNKN